MPKKSEGTGATGVGLEGIVQDANQRLWELHPERDVDGNLIEGEHPDVEAAEREDTPTRPDYEPSTQADADAERERQQAERDADRAEKEQSDDKDAGEREKAPVEGVKPDEQEVPSSPGNSYSTRSSSTPNTPSKSAPKRR